MKSPKVPKPPKAPKAPPRRLAASPEALRKRRFLRGALGLGSGLLLGGCDRLNDSAAFTRLLSSAEVLNLGLRDAVGGARVMERVRPTAAARFLVFHCADTFSDGGAAVPYYESIDLHDAYHPQTLLAWGLNGQDMPVTIERRWFHSPLTMTSKTWMPTKATSSQAMTKCSLRADCRPPSTATQPGHSESIQGDIDQPASTISGSSAKTTPR